MSSTHLSWITLLIIIALLHAMALFVNHLFRPLPVTSGPSQILSASTKYPPLIWSCFGGGVLFLALTNFQSQWRYVDHLPLFLSFPHFSAHLGTPFPSGLSMGPFCLGKTTSTFKFVCECVWGHNKNVLICWNHFHLHLHCMRKSSPLHKSIVLASLFFAACVFVFFVFILRTFHIQCANIFRHELISLTTRWRQTHHPSFKYNSKLSYLIFTPVFYLIVFFSVYLYFFCTNQKCKTYIHLCSTLL